MIAVSSVALCLILLYAEMQIAKGAGVTVIMDAGGAEGPIPEELLKCVTVLSPNETELALLTAMPTNSLEKILLAATKVQEMVRFTASMHFSE